MIIVLTGIPGCGKTTVVSELKDFQELNPGDFMFEAAKDLNLVKNTRNSNEQDCRINKR